MNVLSLFDGMSGGQIALNRAGITVDNYYASELDKYAISVTQANYSNTVQLGDVTRWREWDIDWSSIDLLIGGSPCQGFSFAGKQLAFDDPRSKLFFVYEDILNHVKTVNPCVKFLLENVRMKKEYLGVISEHLGVEPVFINSALVSAQNRQRYYWANWEFGQPGDKGLILSDILEKESDNFTFMSDKFVNRQKGRKCLRDNFEGKAVNLSAMEYVKNGRQGDYILSMIPRGNNKGGDRAIDGKTPTLTSNSWEHNFHLTNDHKSYRKLTPIECERLQTVPDNYTNHVSNTRRYKMLGNGWTVDVISHIFKSMGNTASIKEKEQLELVI
tara:strand:- start:79 stop:1065 length:987 start_codon:yes stop_codon:yes gene_type:complete